MNPYKVRGVLSKPTHAARTEFSPPSANHSPFEAKHSSRFVHSTLWVTPLTSPCPTLSADAELVCKHADTISSIDLYPL